MKILRTASARRAGGIKEGGGWISTQSGALQDYSYGFASLPGADAAAFAGLAAKAKAGCPVSKVLRAAVTLDAALVE